VQLKPEHSLNMGSLGERGNVPRYFLQLGLVGLKRRREERAMFAISQP